MHRVFDSILEGNRYTCIHNVFGLIERLRAKTISGFYVHVTACLLFGGNKLLMQVFPLFTIFTVRFIYNE